MNNTLFLILINLFCFLEQDHFSKYLSQYKFFAPYLVVENKQIIRLLSSNFFHLNFNHLFFNMLGFYSISNLIEVLFKKKYWFIILSIGILSNLINILISLFGLYIYNNSILYYTHSLGLSNIIFGIRALYYKRLNSNVSVFGNIINSSYVVWIELLMIHLLVPNSNFIGHLSGITSGLLLNNYL